MLCLYFTVKESWYQALGLPSIMSLLLGNVGTLMTSGSKGQHDDITKGKGNTSSTWPSAENTYALVTSVLIATLQV